MAPENQGWRWALKLTLIFLIVFFFSSQAASMTIGAGIALRFLGEDFAGDGIDALVTASQIAMGIGAAAGLVLAAIATWYYAKNYRK